MIREIELGFHINWAMPTALPASMFTYNSLLTPCYHETCISYLCSIENSPNVHLGNFLKTLKMEASHCIFVELTINATFVTMESFKQIMQVGIFLVIK